MSNSSRPGRPPKRSQSVTSPENPHIMPHSVPGLMSPGTFPSSDVIKSVLTKRIDSFPKISNKDYPKLRELGDLLMELQSAKAEGDLPGLDFIDTARGVNPIVQKLPFGLQEKWVPIGSNYKQQYHVPFPPCAFFVDFVIQQARIRKDRSFNLVADVPAKADKVPWKQGRQREVSVHKTEVSPTTSSDSDKPIKKADYSEWQCPIHKKPHPLRKCCAFRKKPLDHHKAFLKENGICFRCCSSSFHIANNCKSSVSCAECESKSHNSTLHQGPPPGSKRQTFLQSMVRRKSSHLPPT
ncbi:hypothetical protein J4Q44_G00373530 [Coregonus suidteri]|uniref:Uncharacterized protein n=1 Tax=Coregonus suidteri TaxID=861788 RepID=A0AAN8KL15_9TELE